MLFITPSNISSIAWEGELIASSVSFSKGLAQRPVITIGQPEVWAVDKALEGETGKKWVHPIGNAKFWLVRLALTLYKPTDRSEITEAMQRLFLLPQPHNAGNTCVYAHNMFPQRLGIEDKTTFTLSLGPELGFADSSSIKVGEIGATIEYHKVFPVIQAYGLGEVAPYWIFKPHSAYPLHGSQFVYAVLAAKPPAGGLLAHIEITVVIQSIFGPIKYGTPEEAHRHTELILA